MAVFKCNTRHTDYTTRDARVFRLSLTFAARREGKRDAGGASLRRYRVHVTLKISLYSISTYTHGGVVDVWWGVGVMWEACEKIERCGVEASAAWKPRWVVVLNGRMTGRMTGRMNG